MSSSVSLRPQPSSDGGGSAPRRPIPNRLLILSAFAVVLVACLLAWLIAFSPVLGVKQVTVRGVQNLTAKQVRDTAAIKSGTPLVRLDAAAVRRRVAALPDVASVRVATSYPQTVIITVVERRPVGYVVSGTGFVLVDKTGDQYRAVKTVPHALPRFVIPTGPAAKATGEALATVASAIGPALRARVASIEAFDPTAITLLLTDQRVVRWGSADRSADKARILPTLLGQPGSRYDVSDPDLVVAH